MLCSDEMSRLSSRSSVDLDVLSDSESTSASLSLGSAGKSRSNLRFQHILQKDAFLVFRSLCKLSMKALESQDPKLVCVRMCARVCACARTHVFVCVRVCVRTCVYAHLCVCASISV